MLPHAPRCALLLVLTSLSVAAAQAPNEAEPSEQLRQQGLIAFGRTWICDEEVRLRRALDRVAQLERAFFQARDKFNDLGAEADRVRARLPQLKQLQEQNESRLKQPTLTSLVQRQQLEGESRKLREALEQAEKKLREELNGDDENSPLTKAAIELSDARNALAVELLAVLRHHRAMKPRYARFAADATVQAALAQLGPEETLGPLENYEQQLPRRLEKAYSAVFTSSLPYYRRSGQNRISLILGDETPFTFSLHEAEGPTLIPASLVQLARLPLDRQGEWRQHREAGRKLMVRATTIPVLRVGKFVLRNLPAWVLPPEGEDLGARISVAAFSPLRPELDAEHLRFRVTLPEP